MENIEELDVEVLDNELKPFSYKWTKGDNDGAVCEYDSVFKDATTGVVWVNFKNGTRINYALLNEYMIQIDPVAQRSIRNIPEKDIHDWLDTKYCNPGESKFVLSVSSLKDFKKDYLDIYSKIKEDILVSLYYL